MGGTTCLCLLVLSELDGSKANTAGCRMDQNGLPNSQTVSHGRPLSKIRSRLTCPSFKFPKWNNEYKEVMYTKGIVAASSIFIQDGITWARPVGTRTRLAYVPLLMTATRSPSRKLFTPGPKRLTTPAHSHPIVNSFSGTMPIVVATSYTTQTLSVNSLND